MRIRIGCAHLDRLLSYPDLRYLSGCCLPIRIGALSGQRCPPDVRAGGGCGVAPRSITSSPPISHVIPRGLFQILKSRRCNSNVFSGCSKVTGLNYVRDLRGSVGDGVRQRGERTRPVGRESGAALSCCADTKRRGRCNRIGPASLTRRDQKLSGAACPGRGRRGSP